MEEHALVAEMARSRARLRSLMLPKETGGDRDDDFFPRSTAMRMLLDSRMRGISLSLIASLAAAVMRRRSGGRGAGSSLVESITALVGGLRGRD